MDINFHNLLAYPIKYNGGEGDVDKGGIATLCGVTGWNGDGRGGEGAE